MIGLLFKLAFLGIIVYFIYNMYRKLIKPIKDAMSGGPIPMVGAEECPSCGSRIRVARDHPGTCPKCGAPLGRSPEGKLLIKLN